MRRLTAIYIDSWMSGSHLHSITRMTRFECPNDMDVIEALKHKGIEEKTVFLFDGWPRLVGERNQLTSKVITAKWDDDWYEH